MRERGTGEVKPAGIEADDTAPTRLQLLDERGVVAFVLSGKKKPGKKQGKKTREKRGVLC